MRAGACVAENAAGRQISVAVRAGRRFPVASCSDAARHGLDSIAVRRHPDGHAQSEWRIAPPLCNFSRRDSCCLSDLDIFQPFQ